MAKYHFFDTGSAYDACQCDDSIKDGDCLIIEDEGVIGLAWTYPVAVTKERGHLHQLKDGDCPIEVIGITKEQVDFAVAQARERGYELDRTFALKH